MKLFAITFFLSIQLFSNILCRQKIEKELILLESGYPSWVVDKNHLLTFNPNILDDVNITKQEPLLGLYLINQDIFLKNHEVMKFKKIRSPYRFAMDDESYIPGKIIKPQIGLHFADFSENIEDNLMIISGCCITAGLSIGGTKFIDSDYVKHFVESKNRYLSDIGARFKSIDDRILVDSVNPFFTDNPFLEDDELLYMDGEPVPKLEEFLKIILFSPKDRNISFEILRKNQLLDVNVTTNILQGGGMLSDTFLENIGVWFDEDIFVTNIHKGSPFAKKGLKNRYRLLTINDEAFENASEIRKFFSKQKEKMPDKFTFIFKLKNSKLSIELKSNKKFFKNVKNSNNTHFGGFDNMGFSSLSTGSNIGTGSFTFGGNWNADFKNETDNSYDIYNSIPLAEYLSY